MSSVLNLDKNKCWLCGFRKVYPSERAHLMKYLCQWCCPRGTDIKGLTITEVIDQIEDEAKYHFERDGLMNCENIDVLSFCADFGELAAHHSYLKQFSRMIAMLTTQVARERVYTPSVLMQVAEGRSRQEKWSRVVQCIRFLVDVGLLKVGQGNYIYEVYSPSQTLLDLATTVEAVSNVERELPPRIADCISGYALLCGINISIKCLRESRVLYEDRIKGIMRLYPRDKHGNLLIPKKFTAPVMFLLGHLARGYDEFSDGDIRAWLNPRGISGNQANDIIAWLGRRTEASTQRLVNPKYGGAHFTFNSNYIRMRERFRERRRERGT